jgi:hypothetical protein
MPFFTIQRDQVAALAARHSLPAIYNTRTNVEAGAVSSATAQAFRMPIGWLEPMSAVS